MRAEVVILVDYFVFPNFRLGRKTHILRNVYEPRISDRMYFSRGKQNMYFPNLRWLPDKELFFMTLVLVL
jgi:hypothetical protein